MIPPPPIARASVEAWKEAAWFYRGTLGADLDTAPRVLVEVQRPRLVGRYLVSASAFGVRDAPPVTGFCAATDVVEFTELYKTRALLEPRGVQKMLLGLLCSPSTGLRHLSLRYEYRLRHDLDWIAATVLDPSNPLETLTICVTDSVNHRHHQMRLAPLPPQTQVLRDNQAIVDVLTDPQRPAAYHMVKHIPPGSDNGDRAVGDVSAAQKANGQGVENGAGTTRARLNPILGRKLARHTHSTLGPDSELETRYAVYQVVRPEDADSVEFAERTRKLQRRRLEVLFPGETETRWSGDDIQLDIMAWCGHLELYESTRVRPRHAHVITRHSPRPTDIVCHGFCDSGYGLPDPRKPWYSRNMTMPFDSTGCL